MRNLAREELTANLLERRALGRTGSEVTIITLGGCGVGQLGQDEADKAIEAALNHGINMIDVAPSYGEAEVRLKPWLRKHRNRFFLAEKTLERSKEGAWKELQDSLARLGVRSFDSYQLHAVRDLDDLETALRRGGAIEAFREAKETGLVKHLGLTGHHDVRVHTRALEKFDFDTLLLPVTATGLASPSPVNDFRPVLRMALDRGVGIVAIKVISRGRWKGDRRYTTWYEPSDVQKEIDMMVWFALSQEGVATYSLPCDVRLWPMVMDAAERFRRLSDDEQRTIVEHAKKSGYGPLFPE